MEAAGVGKVYGDGTAALADVSLAVATGETLALVGESGSGKTTLLRTFNRLVTPTAGVVRIAGRAAAELDPIALRREIGYVAQDGGLLPHWTVAKNVELVPRLLGWERRRREERGREMLQLAGLDTALAARYPNELSGGQRQRVAIARALAADPPIVLLDEPFGALDALTRAHLQDSVMAIHQKLRNTVLMITHDVDEAVLLSDRIVMMTNGPSATLGEILEVPLPRPRKRL
ncbi:MAG TPA: ATP-binding cassette domain-containing protein, partial [Thermoanaerobaculia bacterium]